ncbi:MAG: hypothetical protein WC247_03755 [Porticoccaceae bacterium]
MIIRGTAAAALLTTVASRPVWASSRCSISGNLSGNLSGHDHGEPCELGSYSPGGWRNGAAQKKGLWQYVSPYAKQSSIGSLLGVDKLNVEINGKGKPSLTASSTIEQALAGGNHGWERQCAAAALNALLWQNLVELCESNPGNCSALKNVHDRFYFPFMLADIRAIYINGPGGGYPEVWENAQTL